MKRSRSRRKGGAPKKRAVVKAVRTIKQAVAAARRGRALRR